MLGGPESNPGRTGRAAAFGQGLAGGSIVSVWSVTSALAYAGLLYAGFSAAGLQFGISAALLGLLTVTVLGAFGSTSTGIAFAAFGSAAVLHAAAVQATDAVLAAKGVPAGLAREGAAVPALPPTSASRPGRRRSAFSKRSARIRTRARCTPG